MFEKYFIRNLKPGEGVVKIIRPDIFVALPRFAIAMIFFLLPFFLLFLLAQWRWGMLIFLILFFCGFFLLARAFLLWGLHAFVLTTSRIIDFDQHGLFSRTVSETPYENIVDVSYTQKGIFSTLFRFGNVLVHTSGPDCRIVLEDVKYPDKIKEHINDLIERKKIDTMAPV